MAKKKPSLVEAAQEWYKDSDLKKQRDNIEKADGGGLRFSVGKLMMNLIPAEWRWALADVLTKGSYKYSVRNWERGMKWSEITGPMERHYCKFLAGERYDEEESGCHHMAMVAWNALALMSYDLRDIGEDDVTGIVDMELLKRVNSGNFSNELIEAAKAKGVDLTK